MMERNQIIMLLIVCSPLFENRSRVTRARVITLTSTLQQLYHLQSTPIRIKELHWMAHLRAVFWSNCMCSSMGLFFKLCRPKNFEKLVCFSGKILRNGCLYAIFGKFLIRNGYLFLEKLPLDTGMGFEPPAAPEQSKSEYPPPPSSPLLSSSHYSGIISFRVCTAFMGYFSSYWPCRMTRYLHLFSS